MYYPQTKLIFWTSGRWPPFTSMHCCKRVCKLPHTRLRWSSSTAATSLTVACLSSWIVTIRLRNTRSFRNPHRKKIWYSKVGRPSRPSDVAETTNTGSSNAPLRLTIWNGVLSSTVPLPANHDKLSRRRNIQIWNVSVGSAPPCINRLRFVFKRLRCKLVMSDLRKGLRSLLHARYHKVRKLLRSGITDIWRTCVFRFEIMTDSNEGDC